MPYFAIPANLILHDTTLQHCALLQLINITKTAPPAALPDMPAAIFVPALNYSVAIYHFSFIPVFTLDIIFHLGLACIIHFALLIHLCAAVKHCLNSPDFESRYVAQAAFQFVDSAPQITFSNSLFPVFYPKLNLSDAPFHVVEDPVISVIRYSFIIHLLFSSSCFHSPFHAQQTAACILKSHYFYAVPDLPECSPTPTRSAAYFRSATIEAIIGLFAAFRIAAIAIIPLCPF